MEKNEIKKLYYDYSDCLSYIQDSGEIYTNVYKCLHATNNIYDVQELIWALRNILEVNSEVLDSNEIVKSIFPNNNLISTHNLTISLIISDISTEIFSLIKTLNNSSFDTHCDNDIFELTEHLLFHMNFIYEKISEAFYEE